MSVIAGFLNLDAAPAEPEIIEKMVQRLAHRAPDGIGTFIEGPVTLGHGLLSITPESQCESSPYRNANDQHVIAFDGRLDHIRDLRESLGIPVSAGPLPDPELILRAYEKWGTECAIHLLGEFAFALWDRRKRELFCARDAFGQREFYYHLDARRFAFASEIRGVLAVPGAPRQLDELTLGCRLAAISPPGDRTLYNGIRRLPSAHTLTLRVGGQPQIRQYWRLAMEPELRLRSSEEYAEALRELIERSVRSAIRSRHPIAAMLSGGLDSSGVACLAARELAQRGERLQTVSNVLPADFEGEEWAREESGYIRSVLAQYPNMDPRWAVGRAFPVLELDDEHYKLHDEPLADPFSYRTRELVHLAEQTGARVLLGGMGGDMAASFKGAGYLAHLARSGQLLALARQLRLQAETRGIPALRLLRGEVLRPLSPRWLRRWHTRRRFGQQTGWSGLPIHPEFAARMHLSDLRQAADRNDGQWQDFRSRIQAAVNGGQIEGNSRWASRHSLRLESPQPLLDRRLWEWSYKVPLREFCQRGIPRSLYRDALRIFLPPQVQQRTKKGPFAPDFRQRLGSSCDMIRSFLEHHPSESYIWHYADRSKVEAALRMLRTPGDALTWDNQFQLVLCCGLRLAHFVDRLSERKLLVTA